MIIYKVTSMKDNKIYIGKSHSSLSIRMNRHVRSSKNNPKTYFHHALVKHGLENFLWEVIDTTAVNDVELCKLEIEYIFYYQSNGINGYNMTKGGDGNVGGVSHMKGKITSDSTKLKISLANKGKISWNKGLTKNVQPKICHSAEAKQKISQSMKGKIPWNKGIKTGSFKKTGDIK